MIDGRLLRASAASWQLQGHAVSYPTSCLLCGTRRKRQVFFAFQRAVAPVLPPPAVVPRLAAFKMQEGAPSASSLLDDYHCPSPFAFGDFDGAQQLRFVKMYKVAGTSFQFQLQNAARRSRLSTFELPTSGALEGPRAIPDMVLGHQRYGVDHNQERSSVIAVDAAFPEWRHNKSITYVTNLRHPVERAKAFVFWTRYLESWQNTSTEQEELRAEVDELRRNLTHSAGNIAGECRRMHTISFLCGKHCDELFDPFDGKLARPDAVELALEQAKHALVRDVRVVGMMASAQRDTLSILAHMMDDMSVLSSPDTENLHAYSEVHWGWGGQKETYDYPDLTAEELDAAANACAPEMELYDFAIRLHRRQLQCAREARNISSAGTDIAQARQRSGHLLRVRLDTTAETNTTAQTDTAAEAPPAEASDGRQRPWWERLAEKHRELHKRQSWCVGVACCDPACTSSL